MRRSRREFSVFSLAAIDLFCSAMGAFMVISIVLLPFYRAQQEQATPPPPETASVDHARQEAEIERLKKEVNQLQTQIAANTTLAIFGIVTHARSVAIVVDLSGSIYNNANDPKARDYRPQVFRTCAMIIDGMKDGQKLDVIGFHSPDGRTELPIWQPDSVIVNKGSQNSAKAFVQNILLKVSGGTPTRAAIQRALAMDVEAVFLVTDGAPNEGNREGQDLCDEIATYFQRENAGKKEIHCIAVGAYNTAPYLTNFLMRIAKENRGQFLCQPDL